MRLLFCMLLITLNAGCTTMRIIEEPEPTVAVSQLDVGDKVEVITADGNKYRFKVITIDEEEIFGEVIKPGQISTEERVTVRIEDIRLVSRAEFDGVKTAGAAAGGTALVAAIVIAIAILTFTITF